jgi:hypothetical protein
LAGYIPFDGFIAITGAKYPADARRIDTMPGPRSETSGCGYRSGPNRQEAERSGSSKGHTGGLVSPEHGGQTFPLALKWILPISLFAYDIYGIRSLR